MIHQNSTLEFPLILSTLALVHPACVLAVSADTGVYARRACKHDPLQDEVATEISVLYERLINLHLALPLAVRGEVCDALRARLAGRHTFGPVHDVEHSEGAARLAHVAGALEPPSYLDFNHTKLTARLLRTACVR